MNSKDIQETIAQKLQNWKEKLIDLSRRNRLLNFRPTKITTIKIVDELPTEIFKSLVIESNRFRFLPVKEKGLFDELQEPEDSDDIFEEYDIQNLDEKHTDLNLQTNLEPEKLIRNLRRIKFKSHQLMEEQGYNILFLALGMLEWFEDVNSNEVNKSPLIMVPVELHKHSVKAQYRLRTIDEAPFLNSTLSYKLKNDFGISLPELPEEQEGFDPQEHFKIITGLIKEMPRWKVTNEIYLGLFSFSKFIMFKDIEQYSEIFFKNPIIRALARVAEEDQFGGIEFITADELDKKRLPHDTFQVLDADSSQQEVIEAVKSGLDLVIQGPPGTGKSQTIANIIAESLAQGKKTLFVSEKMAALDVVYKRLKEVGLDEYCLEIHSRKANKRHVLEQLQYAYESKHPGKIKSAQLEELVALRRNLNAYSQALHSPISPFGKSPFWAIGQLTSLRDVEIIDLDTSSFKEWTFEQYQSVLKDLLTLKERIGVIGYPLEHPWWGIQLDHPVNEYERQKIQKDLSDLKTRIEELDALINNLSAKIGTSIDSISLSLAYCRLLKVLSENHTIPESLISIENAKEFLEKIESVLAKIKKLQISKVPLNKLYIESIADEDVYQLDLTDEYEEQMPEALLDLKDQMEKLDLEVFVKNLSRQIGISIDSIFLSLAYCQLLKVLSENHTIPESLILIENAEEFLERIEPILAKIEQFKASKAMLNELYDGSVFNEDLYQFYDLLTGKYRSFWRIFFPKYHRLRKSIQKHSKDEQTKKYDELVSDLENLLEHIELKRGVESTPDDISTPLGNLWQDISTDVAGVRKALEWLIKYQDARVDKEDDQHLSPFILDSKAVSGEMLETVNAIESKAPQFKNAWQDFELKTKTGAITDIFGDAIDKFSPANILEVINLWLRVDTLLKNKYKSFWRTFVPEYHRIRKSTEKHSVDKESDGHDSLVSDLKNLLKHQYLELKTEIESTPDDISIPLGNLWQDISTDVAGVRKALEWLIKYQDARVDKEDDQHLSPFILDSKAVSGEILETANAIESKSPQFKKAWQDFESRLKIDVIDVLSNTIDKCLFANICTSVNRWLENIDKLVDWTRYQRAIGRCREAGLSSYLEFVIKSRYSPDEIVSRFKKAFIFNWFQSVVENNPLLKEFESLHQNQIVSKFQEFDKSQLEIAKIRMKERLFNAKPDSSWSGSRSSELGYLQHQFRLGRGHAPIRKLFSNIPNVIQSLTPCLMMSPLSLAQFVNPEKMHFDVVIFDEASQIAPEDSVGAIIRGNQLVVAGDTNQLPPTSFFKAEVMTVEDEESEELDFPDLESILDECSTAGFRSFTLRWHYRSRHESLIHFSNKHLYKNELNTFPSPVTDSKKLGVSLIHIPDAEYDRGRSKRNPKEAREAARYVFNHLKTYPEKSLGVGCFSQSQQLAILDAIEDLRREDPSLEHFFNPEKDEPFFVKNLETIQGDERDVILISVGYGKDSNGRLFMGFGPLSQEGGERRLNVLVTRARERVVVFSSILGDDFDLSKTQSKGVHLLKQYLDYAKAHGDHIIISHQHDSFGNFDEENLFERSVFEQITAKGVKLISQVGFCDYKIDFGVLDPDNPSRFILGIECDGASYHSSKTARDRDRLRQSVLENLGWRFHRIWSTDWFLNHSREMERLLESIDEAKKNPGVDLINSLNANKFKIELKEIDEKVEENHFGIEIKPYKRHPVETKGFPGDFYEQLDFWPSRIEDIILAIIDTEGPIHIKELALRLIQHYGMNRVGGRIYSLVMDLLEQLASEDKLIFKDDFADKIDFVGNFVRKRDIDGAVTNIEFIPPEEIQNAICLVARKEFSVPRNELIPKTARVFGFQHTGKKINQHINREIARLLKEKVFVKTDHGLRYVK